jgi:hypothetical protein
MEEQKQRRLTSCEYFIDACQDSPIFLDCIVTADESWVFQYDPETKLQSMQWTSESPTRPRNFLLQKSKIKTMLITFFDKQGVIHKEFIKNLCLKGTQSIVLYTISLDLLFLFSHQFGNFIARSRMGERNWLVLESMLVTAKLTLMRFPFRNKQLLCLHLFTVISFWHKKHDRQRDTVN